MILKEHKRTVPLCCSLLFYHLIYKNVFALTVICDRINKENIAEEVFPLKLTVDQDLCIGCGLCIDTCPSVFDWNDDGKAQVIVDEVPEDVEDDAREAMENCAAEAIKEE